MLHFHNLSILDPHQQFLQTKSWKSDIFLVGWCVRDLLLWLTTSPTDIDFTTAGNPFQLYESFDKDWLSHFITEKFWTSTFIQQTDPTPINYELTPLRTEGDYWDFRHPWDIQRSDDILADSQRRDFTINAMYYFSFWQKKTKKLDFNPNIITIDTYKLLKVLNKEWYIYLPDQNLLILQKNDYISQTFPNAEFDETFCRYLIETWISATISDGNLLQSSDIILWSSPTFRILIDPQNWLKNLIEKTIETVGDWDKRFGEDALRLMRALRITNVLNFKLWNDHLFDFTSQTRDSLKRNSNLISHVAKERIKDELTKVFKNWNPFSFLVLLKVSEMLPIIFPSLAETINIEQPIRYHAFDVYTHTMLALKAVQELNSDYLVRLAILYHDVGKVWQYEAYLTSKWDKEKIRQIIAWPLNHRNSSPQLMNEDFKKLGFSNKEIDEISRYIAQHHTPWEILNSNPANREKKLRALLSEKWFEKINNLLDINIADRMWQFNPLQSSGDLSDSYTLKEILKKLNDEEGQFKPKDLLLDWKILLQKYWLKPWPIIWETLKAVFERVLNDIDSRNNEKEIDVFTKNWLNNKDIQPLTTKPKTPPKDTQDEDFTMF